MVNGAPHLSVLATPTHHTNEEADYPPCSPVASTAALLYDMAEAEETVQRQHALILELQADQQHSMDRIQTLVELVAMQQRIVEDLQHDMLTDHGDLMDSAEAPVGQPMFPEPPVSHALKQAHAQSLDESQVSNRPRWLSHHHMRYLHADPPRPAAAGG